MAAPKPPNTVLTPQTSQQLQSQAEQQVGAEISSEVSPLQGQVGTLQSREQAAHSGLETMFGSILPYVQGAAGAVQTSYDEASKNVSGIMAAATQRLNDLKQQRGQEAQALAQQIGGPVAVEEFTAGVTPYQEEQAALGAGSQLHTLGMAQAGVQEANAFAGRVFPLIRTEQEAESRRYFEDQISELNKEIASIQGQKGGRVNKRMNELLVQEREFQLQKSQQALDRLKANRDWVATKKTLAADKARLELAKGEFGLTQAGVTGKYKGKPTLAAKESAAQIAAQKRSDALAAKQLGLSVQEFQLRKQELLAGKKVADAKRNVDQRAMAMDIIDAAVSGRPTKVEQTVTTEVTAETAALNKKAYGVKGADGKTHYYIDRPVTQTIQQATPVSNPDRLYNMLLSYRIPKAMAAELVRNRLAMPSWAPGKTEFKAADVKAMPFNQLRGLAINLGFIPDPTKPKTRKQLQTFVLGKLKKRG